MGRGKEEGTLYELRDVIFFVQRVLLVRSIGLVASDLFRSVKGWLMVTRHSACCSAKCLRTDKLSVKKCDVMVRSGGNPGLK